jgi:hypothetical protein
MDVIIKRLPYEILKTTECFLPANMLSVANTGYIDIATYCNVLDHYVNMIKRPKVIGPNS